MSAIDHMEYHPTQSSNQCEQCSTSQPYCWQHVDITPVEAQFIDDLLHTLQSINPCFIWHFEEAEEIHIVVFPLGV